MRFGIICWQSTRAISFESFPFIRSCPVPNGQDCLFAQKNVAFCRSSGCVRVSRFPKKGSLNSSAILSFLMFVGDFHRTCLFRLLMKQYCNRDYLTRSQKPCERSRRRFFQILYCCWLHVSFQRHLAWSRRAVLKSHDALKLQFGSLDFFFDMSGCFGLKT